MVKFENELLGIKDYYGIDLREGDIIKFPDEGEIGVIRYEPNGCQFRIQFNPKTHFPSCHIGLQMGKKAKAYKIGSMYGDANLVDWGA